MFFPAITGASVTKCFILSISAVLCSRQPQHFILLHSFRLTQRLQLLLVSFSPNSKMFLAIWHNTGISRVFSFVRGFRSLVEVESTYWWVVKLFNMQNKQMDVHQSRKSKILRYLLHAPLKGQVWHKAFFGGSERRAVAHTRPAFPQNAYGPVGIPLIKGASGAGRLTQPSRRE